ncbi:hypothetical protein GCM10027421_36380 [Microbacterium shaanxiense]
MRASLRRPDVEARKRALGRLYVAAVRRLRGETPVVAESEVRRAPGRDWPTRRKVVIGAAWAPSVIAAAVAVPVAAASSIPLACPVGVRPAVQAIPQVSTSLPVIGTIGEIRLSAGTVRVDTTALVPMDFGAAAMISVTYTLTMSSGTTHMAVGEESLPITIGTVADLPAGTFRDIRFPNGTYTAAASLQRPTHLTATVTIELTPADSSAPISCPYVLSWSLAAVATGAVIFGAGTLTYVGTIAAI